MEGLGVHGMPCTCDWVGARKSRSRLRPLRHSMPGAGTRSVESPWLAMEFIAGSRLLLSRSRLRLYIIIEGSVYTNRK